MPEGSRPDAAHAQHVARKLRDAVNVALAGKSDVVERAVTTVLARGHLLIEDIPGVGKTTLARALARAIGAEYRRVQCTSDLMPSDILGVNVYNASSSQFDFRPGPIFTTVLLADEINRATPKTQSALLEAMSERQVTIDGVTRELTDPFIVIATQNPEDTAGTYPLPDSQLDRFFIRTRVGYPSPEVEKQLLFARQEDTAANVKAVITRTELLKAQHEVDLVRVDPDVLDYAFRIVAATRSHDAVTVGVSTRGAKLFLRAACSRAIVQGRDYLTPDDVSEMAVAVLSHRLRMAGGDPSLQGLMGENRRDEAERVVQDIVTRTDVPL